MAYNEYCQQSIKHSNFEMRGIMNDVVQVNVSMDRDTAVQLDQMAEKAGYDNRSAFVRWLIRQEANRQSNLAPQPEPVKEG